jgi:hypothetical protein
MVTEPVSEADVMVSTVSTLSLAGSMIAFLKIKGLVHGGEVVDVVEDLEKLCNDDEGTEVLRSIGEVDSGILKSESALIFLVSGLGELSSSGGSDLVFTLRLFDSFRCVWVHDEYLAVAMVSTFQKLSHKPIYGNSRTTSRLNESLMKSGALPQVLGASVQHLNPC